MENFMLEPAMVYDLEWAGVGIKWHTPVRFRLPYAHFCYFCNEYIYLQHVLEIQTPHSNDSRWRAKENKGRTICTLN